MACQLAPEQGHMTTSVVLNELRRAASSVRRTAHMLETPDALVLLPEPVANCARYDTLRGVSHVGSCIWQRSRLADQVPAIVRNGCRLAGIAG